MDNTDANSHICTICAHLYKYYTSVQVLFGGASCCKRDLNLLVMAFLNFSSVFFLFF